MISCRLDTCCPQINSAYLTPQTSFALRSNRWKSAKNDDEVIYLFAKVSYDEDNAKLTGGMHIQLFVEELYRRDPLITTPEAFITINQASIRLRGLCHALRQPRSLAKAWKPIAEKVLKEEA